MKKVLLFLIDSMMPDILEQCIAAGKAPGLQFFMEKGQYIPDCVTVFPTMTASIDCSMITGVYPDQHKVPGLVWYDPDNRELVNYINGTVSVGKIGLEQCAKNVLFDLNERHLSRDVKTIHEELEENGRISGSINVIAHRGHKQHKVSLPPLLDVATGFTLREKISGPTLMSLGTLVKPGLFRPIVWNFSQSAWEGYGINDTHAIDVLIEVVKSGQQPDFTLIYLPENDRKLHRAPGEAVQHLADVDKELVRFLDIYPSWDQVLKENVCIFVSDHGQTLIGESKEHDIDLESLLSSYAILRLGAKVSEKDEVVLCNNERMTYLYPLVEGEGMDVVDAVSGDERIDLIAWKEGEKVRVMRGGSRESMCFWKAGTYQDVYGQSWSCEGDLQVLDVRLVGNELHFDAYPDAFARLYGALFAQEAPVIVLTAAPGYEFVSEASPTHLGGGSHGSLHKRDSLVPLLVAGSSRRFKYPARVVDLKAFILEELNVPVPGQ